MAKFGVEIECEIDENAAVSALQNIEGIRAFNRMCGYHENRDFSMWRVEYDSSVHNGCEVVSPILDTETDGFEQIKKVCRALTSAGGRVNVSCGLHVHVAIPDLTIDWLKNIIKRYANNTPTIDSFMPRSRRSGGSRAEEYCSAMTTVLNFPLFQNPSSLHTLTQSFSRFYAINATNYPRLGTIEFRQHSGTLNAEKIRNWVSLLVSFIEASKPLPAPANTMPEIDSSVSTTGDADEAARRFRIHRDYLLRPSGMIRGRNRRMLVKILTSEVNMGNLVTMDYLCGVTGFSENSLRSTISYLRRMDFQITYNRRQRAYGCTALPRIDLGLMNRLANYHNVRDQQIDRTVSRQIDRAASRLTGQPADQQQTENVELADFWTGISSEIRSYYVERSNDLA